MKPVKVVWSDLDSFQKELVVALFNNSGAPLPTASGGVRFWASCEIAHPTCQVSNDRFLCDSSAQVTKAGRLKLSGRTNFHGYGKSRSETLPDDVKIEISAFIGK